MGIIPKVQLPDHVSTKLTYRRVDCWTGAGREGNFFFVGQEDAVGAGVRRLESRMGQGRVGKVEGWEVEGKWRVWKGFIDWKVGWSGVRE